MAYTWTDLSAGMPLAATTLNGLGNEVETLSSLVREPVIAQMKRTTAQSISASTWTLVDHNTIVTESQPGILSLANDTITIPTTGIWLLSLSAATTNAQGTGNRGSAVTRNSTDPNSGTVLYSFIVAQATGAQGLGLTGPVLLTQGDLIRGYLFSTVATTTSGVVEPSLSATLLFRT